MFEWRDYLDFAKGLVASSERSEASLRAAASRAYYAAFHKSREAVERELGAKLGQDAVHAEVIRRLRQQSGTETLGANLDRLRKTRSHADYNADSAFPARHAEIAVDLASDVLRQLGQA
jgi:uncharacterized protein (UPF0332 family)